MRFPFFPGIKTTKTAFGRYFYGVPNRRWKFTLR